MKRSILMSIVALAIMGCSKNEVISPEDESKEIKFSYVQLGNNTSQANKVLTGGETFGVYAYLVSPTATPYFEDVKLSRVNNSWGLAEKYYYPTGDFNMTLWAYGKVYGENKPTSVDEKGMTYTDYSIEQQEVADLARYEGFVLPKVANLVTQANKTTPISLILQHALCKVNFTAKVTGEGFENVSTKIESITIKTSNTGSIAYSSAASKWTPGATLVDRIVSLQDATIATTNTPVSDPIYLIPLASDNAKNTVSVTAKLYNANTSVEIGEIIGTFDAAGAQLAINNSVTYNIIIDRSSAGATEITFGEPTIEDWNPVNGGDQSK